MSDKTGDFQTYFTVDSSGIPHFTPHDHTFSEFTTNLNHSMELHKSIYLVKKPRLAEPEVIVLPR